MLYVQRENNEIVWVGNTPKIGVMLDMFGDEETVPDDVIAYVNSYKTKRAAEYPNITDYLDAKAKQASTDETTKAEGEAQEAAYLAACLAVKAKYPKPTS